MEVDNDGNSATQIRISLQLYQGCDESLKVPSLPMAVPANLKRKGLASIVNHLLGRTSDEQDTEDEDEDSSSTASRSDNKLAPLPFDFLIQKTNRLLRTSLENAVRSSGLSTEEDLLISYFPAVKPPQTGDDSEPLPDWVSTVSHCTGREFGSNVFISGAYDGIIRVHDVSSGTVLSQAQAHDGPIKCMSVHASNATSSNIMIATGSGDHTLATHCYIGGKKSSLRLHAEYIGTHTDGIEAARFNSDGNTLASADWNGNVALWQVPDISEFDTDANVPRQSKKKSKRAKTDLTGTDSSNNTCRTVTAGVTWKAHSSNVSGVVWGSDSKHLITGSWDHSVKTWDAERQDCLLTLNGARVVTTLDRCSNSDIIATGHPDSAVRLWDMRVGGSKEQSKVLDASLKTSHKAWISAVEWSLTEPHMLATASHDGFVKMWDIRSTLPLHSVRAHKKGEKGLCVTLGEKVAFSGGSDCMVKKLTW